ncbi:hypothetical protein CS542_10200 [Pedobacter sp. IW39]|nr:hypothetical protein CS542_10200 [Pedobacter sp. IW39]
MAAHFLQRSVMSKEPENLSMQLTWEAQGSLEFKFERSWSEHRCDYNLLSRKGKTQDICKRSWKEIIKKKLLITGIVLLLWAVFTNQRL